MGLELLKITGYSDENFSSSVGEPYTVMINPESIKWNRKIDYNMEQAPDTSNPSQTYKSTPSADFSFDIVIDCTGVVDSSRTDMATEISKLETIVYTYNGKIHRPNYVEIRWGKKITFTSVLKSFDITYTLFKPDGSPLRAKISLSFGEYISAKSVAQEDKKSSPDLTHIIHTIDGDTLPELSNRIYNSTDYYMQIASYNGLNKFRNLQSGQRLSFPPLLNEEGRKSQKK